MQSRTRSIIRRVLPENIAYALRFLRNVFRMLEKRRTQRIFAAATDAPPYLDVNALEMLQMKYPYRLEYGYDAHSLEERGVARAAQILRLPGARKADSFLELGCGDAMVSCILCRKGKKAAAIDKCDTGFDERASSEGVDLFKMDAVDLRFEDESFDFVFSYESFEHFASPEDVLREAIRVVRENGYIYLEFGPLYYSAFGEHAYRSITVPFCQFLFPRDLINDFATRKGLIPIDFAHVNGWSLESYRGLWNKYSHILKRIRYHEIVDLSHLRLIRLYPSCFRSRSSYFDNFIVSNICVLFQKSAKMLDQQGGLFHGP